MTRRHPEQQLQQAVARYLDVALPGEVWWTTIPAGGGGKVRGAILKGLGYKAGTPDILIVYEGRAYWMELKAPDGVLSTAQMWCFKVLCNAGCWRPHIVRSLVDVERALDSWRIPHRATVAA